MISTEAFEELRQAHQEVTKDYAKLILPNDGGVIYITPKQLAELLNTETFTGVKYYD